MEEALLNVNEVAQRLGGISPWTVYAWLSKKRLRKTKIGSRVMVSEAHLQEFIAHCNAESDTSNNLQT